METSIGKRIGGYIPKSKTVVWETPQDLFDRLNAEFGFTVDVAANADNAKVPKFYDEIADGLTKSWDGETVWCNPPYGLVIKDWVKKAAESDCTTVMLIPSRTDTRWFHEYIYGKVEIRFIKGRLKFGGATTSAPFPSMVVVFRNQATLGRANRTEAA